MRLRNFVFEKRQERKVSTMLFYQFKGEQIVSSYFAKFYREKLKHLASSTRMPRLDREILKNDDLSYRSILKDDNIYFINEENLTTDI